MYLNVVICLQTEQVQATQQRQDGRNEDRLYQSTEHPGLSLQHSLKAPVQCHGIGVHGGHAVTMTLHPAPANSGIAFCRTDMLADLSRFKATIPASWDLVSDTRLCTVLRNSAGASISTVEHVMSALRGCGIDNALIEIDGPEIPIMDGSAAPFVALIEQAGIVAQDAIRKVIRILKPISIGDDSKWARLDPADTSSFRFSVDFAGRPGLEQTAEIILGGDKFRYAIARARTFGFLEEVAQLRAAGLARGGSLDNAIVIDGENIINPDGLRYADELARHKILDAIGDLYLAGAAIEGAYSGFRAGHAVNNQLLHALFTHPDCWEWHPAPSESRSSISTWQHELVSV